MSTDRTDLERFIEKQVVRYHTKHVLAFENDARVESCHVQKVSNDGAEYLVRVEWTLAPDFDEPDLHLGTRYDVRVLHPQTRRLYIREAR